MKTLAIKNIAKQSLLVLATAGVLTSTAHATGGHPYIGAKLGQFSVDVKDNDNDFENPTAYGVYAGYSLDHHFGLEGEYITSSDADVTLKDKKISDFNAETIGAYLTYHQHIPAVEELYVKGKLGFAQTSVEAGNDKEDDTGIAGGIAVGFNIAPQFSIEGEYAMLPKIESDTVEVDANLWTLGAHFRF